MPEGEKFLKEWLVFLIEESTFSGQLINDVYQKLIDSYGKYEKLTTINHNLVKHDGNPLI
jgi:hypothetical protein